MIVLFNHSCLSVYILHFTYRILFSCFIQRCESGIICSGSREKIPDPSDPGPTPVILKMLGNFKIPALVIIKSIKKNRISQPTAFTLKKNIYFVQLKQKSKNLYYWYLCGIFIVCLVPDPEQIIPDQHRIRIHNGFGFTTLVLQIRYRFR